MNIAFYITNHGFGHASRNVPIVNELLRRNSDSKIYIKSDRARCDFLKRNFGDGNRIEYFYDCNEYGLILQPGKMKPDVEAMRKNVSDDYKKWPIYIARETAFLKDNNIDFVVADIICWPIRAAKECGVPCALIGNFDWAEMYSSFFDSEFYQPYIDCYSLADIAIWYDIHSPMLHEHNTNFTEVSLVSRAINPANIDRIKSQYKRDVVFFSLGASAELDGSIDVSELPYDFIITRGVNLVGDNVTRLPDDIINTMDYIAACDYVIAKGGWSTVAEILLQKKKSALLMRGGNEEDDTTERVLKQRKHAVILEGESISTPVDIQSIIYAIDKLEPTSYDIYHNDVDKICNIILGLRKDNYDSI